MRKMIEDIIGILKRVRGTPSSWLGPDTSGGFPPAFVFITGLYTSLKVTELYPQALGPIVIQLRAERGWPHNSAFIWQLMQQAGWTSEAITDGLLDFEIEAWTRLARQLQQDGMDPGAKD
jgi:hypothetical protein